VQQIPQALFATLSARVTTYEEQFGAASKQLDTTRSELQYARLKIQVLEEHLRLRWIAKYGPGSEKLSNLQLQLLEEEPGVSNQEVQAESEREGLPAPDGEKQRKRRAHPGRQTFSADLPRRGEDRRLHGRAVRGQKVRRGTKVIFELRSTAPSDPCSETRMPETRRGGVELYLKAEWRFEEPVHSLLNIVLKLQEG
jgi:hypothetical protein